MINGLKGKQENDVLVCIKKNIAIAVIRMASTL